MIHAQCTYHSHRAYMLFACFDGKMLSFVSGGILILNVLRLRLLAPLSAFPPLVCFTVLACSFVELESRFKTPVEDDWDGRLRLSPSWNTGVPHETTLLKPPLTTPFRPKLLLPITPIRSVAYALMLGTTFVETAVYPQAVPYTTCPESNFELGNPVVFHVSLRLRASISLQTWHPVKKDCRQLHRFTAVVSHVLRSIPVFFKVAWAYLCSGG